MLIILKFLKFNFVADLLLLQIKNSNKLQKELDESINKVFSKEDSLMFIYKSDYGDFIPLPNRNSHFLWNYETEFGIENQ